MSAVASFWAANKDRKMRMKRRADEKRRLQNEQLFNLLTPEEQKLMYSKCNQFTKSTERLNFSCPEESYMKKLLNKFSTPSGSSGFGGRSN